MALFSNDYQGGPSFEVCSPQGSNPLGNWKITGPGSKGTKKVYEKDVKGYLFNCPGGHGFKMQFPKDERKSMCLLQNFLVLQVHISNSQQFSLELSVSTVDNTRRRLFLSSSFQDIKATSLHAQIPLRRLQRDGWVNLVLGLGSLVEGSFPGYPFRSLDLLILGGCFKLRRIFTLKQPPPDTLSSNPEAMGATVPVPVALDFPIGVPRDTQVLGGQGFWSHLPADKKIGTPLHSGQKNDSSDLPVFTLELGIQGEASPQNKRLGRDKSNRTTHGSARKDILPTPESRIPGPQGASNTRRISRNGAIDRSDQDDGRRAQSAAVQRQGTKASTKREEKGAESPAARKVLSAAGPGTNLRNCSLAAANRPSAAPPRIFIDPFVGSQMAAVSPLSSPLGGDGHSGPLSPQHPSKPPSAIAGSTSPRACDANGNTRGSILEPKSPDKKAHVHKGLPDVTGVSIESGISKWETDSFIVSGSKVFGQQSLKGRYGEGASWTGKDSALGSDGKRFWRDVSQTSVEDVPLHRQLDHLHMSPSGRARVARLPSQQGQVSTSSIGKPAVLESQPPSPIVTSRSLLKVQMDNLGEAAPIQAMSPGSLRISSLQMQAMTVTAPVPEAMRSTSPKQHRMESLGSASYSFHDRHQQEMAGHSISCITSSRNRVELKSIERASFGHPEPSAQLAGEPLTRLESRRASEDVRHSVCSSACEVDEDEILQEQVSPRNTDANDGMQWVGEDTGSVHPLWQPCADSCGHGEAGGQGVGVDEPGPHQARRRRLSEEFRRTFSATREIEQGVLGGESSPWAALQESPRLKTPDGRMAARNDSWAISDDAYSAVNIINQQRAFTPPVVPPSKVHDSPTRALGGQGDGGAARNNHRGITDGDTSIEYRDLIYDPILNCYYDSKSNQYFALN